MSLKIHIASANRAVYFCMYLSHKEISCPSDSVSIHQSNSILVRIKMRFPLYILMTRKCYMTYNLF